MQGLGLQGSREVTVWFGFGFEILRVPWGSGIGFRFRDLQGIYEKLQLRAFRFQGLPAPPKYPLIAPLWSVIVGIWGIIEGSCRGCW